MKEINNFLNKIKKSENKKQLKTFINNYKLLANINSAEALLYFIKLIKKYNYNIDYSTNNFEYIKEYYTISYNTCLINNPKIYCLDILK